jgi:uncharacterized membrane protein YfcA
MFFIELPAAGVTVWAPALVILGLIAGMLAGLFGVGGGFLLTPILKIAFGIPYPVAVGSNLVLIGINAGLSSFRHWRNRCVDIKLGAILAAGGMCGAEIGVRLMRALGARASIMIHGQVVSVRDLTLSGLFLILLGSVGISILLESSRTVGEEPSGALSKMLRGAQIWPMITFSRAGVRMMLWAPLAIALSVGVLTGLLGISGGFINFPLLVYVIGAPTLVAVGTSAFQSVYASAYGAIRHAGEGNVELILVGLLLAGSIPGVQIGVRISRMIGGRRIRKWFAIVILLALCVIIWDVIRQLGVA